MSIPKQAERYVQSCQDKVERSENFFPSEVQGLLNIIRLLRGDDPDAVLVTLTKEESKAVKEMHNRRFGSFHAKTQDQKDLVYLLNTIANQVEEFHPHFQHLRNVKCQKCSDSGVCGAQTITCECREVDLPEPAVAEEEGRLMPNHLCEKQPPVPDSFYDWSIHVHVRKGKIHLDLVRHTDGMYVEAYFCPWCGKSAEALSEEM